MAAIPHSEKEVFCIDCIFCLPNPDFTDHKLRMKHAYCRHEQSFRSDEAYRAYLVSGVELEDFNYLTMCVSMRNEATMHPCGRPGRLFQPKPVTVLAIASSTPLPMTLWRRMKHFFVDRFFTKPPYP
jgi:hypothetical protein